ncbi:helix-turn-helix domain-containing protein [Variovorax paradoxus]|uniref:Anaerobic benzoate catabolism transcriptional regulator n=1 Tax=Variovorax paradoxus TaxID=34073 RepID=A0A0H2M5V4_VARPD|nr:helix-turn-helix transcriptional regulator [Variovorax paradoxus]KLN57521.1 anaerobic benzoate catabolism transcriptional regulator [Variovorax paradoxus]
MPRAVANKPQPLDSASSKELKRLQQTFGEHLRALRHDRLITIEQLAELAGLHPNYVGSVERGERNLSLFNIWRLASSLEVSVSQLVETLPPRVVKRVRRAS